MTRIAPFVAALALGATVATPAAAAKPAKVLRGPLNPVRADVAYYTKAGGSAQLVAGRRNANLVVKVRGLFRNRLYAYALLAGGCPVATPVEGLQYQVLATDGSGAGTATAKAKKGQFARDLATGYSVVVMQTGTIDQPLLCGTLGVKATKGGAGKGKGKAGKGGKSSKGGRSGKGGRRS